LGFPEYSTERVTLDPGYGPHGCLWERGNYLPNSPNWVIFNSEYKEPLEPSSQYGRQIICQSEYAEGAADGSCPEGFVPITDTSTCETAAVYLEVPETTPTNTADGDKSSMPVGCYHTIGQNAGLFFNDNSDTTFVADSLNYILCRKKWAVRLFAVNINHATSISFSTNGETKSIYLSSGTMFKTLDWLEVGQDFSVSYNPTGQPQSCYFRHFDAESGTMLQSSTLGEQIPTGIPSVVTINFYCMTLSPTTNPTIPPSVDPTLAPSFHPTTHPTNTPTSNPSINPTLSPTLNPTLLPSKDPSTNPTKTPSFAPTTDPSHHPTVAPTLSPTAVPCNMRSQETCVPGDGPYCHYNNETESCVELDACPATGDYSCASYCGIEVDRCGIAHINSTYQCSCELCDGLTSCEQQRHELIRLDADFDTVFPEETREASEQQFLSECNDVLAPVECINVFDGSIFLEIQGDESDVAQAVSNINSAGLTLPSFGTFSVVGSIPTTRSGLNTDDDDGFGTIWIVLIIIGVCMCILVGCFLNHRRKTFHDYQGGATPRPESHAVLEMDGKKIDYSDAKVKSRHENEDLEESFGAMRIDSSTLVSPIRKREFDGYSNQEQATFSAGVEPKIEQKDSFEEFSETSNNVAKKAAPPLPPRPVSAVEVGQSSPRNKI